MPSPHRASLFSSLQVLHLPTEMLPLVEEGRRLRSLTLTQPLDCTDLSEINGNTRIKRPSTLFPTFYSKLFLNESNRASKVVCNLYQAVFVKLFGTSPTKFSDMIAAGFVRSNGRSIPTSAREM